MKNKILLLVAACAVIAGCTPYKELTPGGESVKFVESKPKDCKSLGDIDSSGMGLTRSESLTWIRNKAAAEGADTFRIENESIETMSGYCIGCPNQMYAHRAYIYKCDK
ncbi:MAG: DUF4156 domain-containing protein [Alphaproteobacteria bacterium]|nr:DUF4156 domain-containing protein [Alphaproteobacteria bacterium]